MADFNLHFTAIEKEKVRLGLEKKNTIVPNAVTRICSLPSITYRALIWHIVVSKGGTVSKYILDAVFNGSTVNYSTYAIEGVVQGITVYADYINGNIVLDANSSTGDIASISTVLISNITI